jgi:CHAT domain-containing protein
MKKTFIILFLLLPVMTFGQSKESNNHFKKGIKLLDAEKYGEALTYFQKSDSLDKAKLKPTHKNYYRAELKMADCYEELADYNDEIVGNYKEALRLETITVEIRKRILGEGHPDYAKAICYLAYYYDLIGNYTEAVKLATVGMKKCRKILGEEHPDYAYSLSILAICYKDLGNYTEAVKFGTIAMEINKKIYGEEHIEYASSLFNLAEYYCRIGNYSEAIELETVDMKITKKIFGEEHPYYASALTNLSHYYYSNGNFDEAIRLGTIATEIYKTKLGEEHPDYLASLNGLAVYYYKNGNYTEALRLQNIETEISKKILGEEHPHYAVSLYTHAYYYLAVGNYAEAIRFATLALEIRKKILGEEHPVYNISLHQLADFNIITGDYETATNYFQQCYHRLNSFILKTFASMTTNERNDFWKRYSDFFTKDLPYAVYKRPDTLLTSLTYDSQIFSKCLLLNAELEIQKLIEQSGDTTFANRYYKIKNDRATLDDLYQISPEKRKINADSLQKVIDNEERLLVESSKALGDYTKNLSISWRDVQRKLKDNDLAIEFVNFKDTASKKEIYAVLILKQDMNSPEFVKLFDSDEFLEINSDEYYKKSDFYNLVWKKLETYLTGVKNVYFSPCGMFHTVGIEYLPDESGKIFAEKFNVYRLSSTRELALERKQNPNKKAATYGGIKYDSDKGGGNVRGVATYLKGTKIESETVAKLLLSADFSVIALSDTLATEESFKNLSGSGLKILHIGTHGFYYAAENLENAGFSFFSNNNQQSEEDKALSCSGLLFAGANVALDKETRNALPEGDDGILTAKEISRLDFKGLDLVVLSACQTGLGEVTGEGVFGLQRGFKKAGAQTIIMSLWEVDDYATRLLMTEFFKGLTLGKSKREAFLAALDFVKAKNSDPKYWAAFVMVDGI